ncbi:hypothetical protein U716_10715 [Rhodobacter capsulatus B6]|nr:hypothetical protein U716_10715 [Rhodobacter capsulatus B6]
MRGGELRGGDVRRQKSRADHPEMFLDCGDPCPVFVSLTAVRGDEMRRIGSPRALGVCDKPADEIGWQTDVQLFFADRRIFSPTILFGVTKCGGNIFGSGHWVARVDCGAMRRI